MQKAYVPLDDLVDFLTNRNNELTAQKEPIKSRQTQNEARIRQKEVVYLMEEFPRYFSSKLVFAETEEE